MGAIQLLSGDRKDIMIVLIMANDGDTSKNFRDGRSLEQTPGTVEVEVAMWIISTVQKLCFLCHEEA